MQSLFIFSLLPLLALAAPSPAELGLEKRSITCLKVGATATATWTNSASKTCKWTGIVGSNFGTNTVNSGDYSCNGRCGAGCTGAAIGNAYTQDCFSHDICSYFNNASGGASDANCGAAYSAAVDDTIGGTAAGCGATNPTNAAVAPTVTPVCT